MPTMQIAHRTLIAALLIVLVGCAEKGEQVYKSWTGPDRATMTIVTLELGPGVKDLTIRDRLLSRSEYGSLQLSPGQYTLQEKDEAGITFTIRPILIDASKARAEGELVLGHTYTLHAGKSDGERALWIEDARSGEVFVDTR